MRDPNAPREIGRLERRADFLRVAKGKRWHGKAMSLQVALSPNAAGTRFGFTLTRKVGNAVIRNRARRRLKEAVRLTPDLPVRDGHDYVIVGRIDAVGAPFDALQRDLARAIDAVHQTSGDPRPKRTARKR